MTTNREEEQQKKIAQRRNFTFRLNIFFFVIFILFSVLIVRLAILQFVDRDALAAIKQQSSLASYDYPPIRGGIYDRNGSPIAVSKSSQSLYFRYDTSLSRQEIIALAKQLAQIFSDKGDPNITAMSAEDILKAMNAGTDIDGNEVMITDYLSSLRRIKTDLTKAEVAYIMEHQDEFPSLSIVEESSREYVTHDDGTDRETGIAVQLVGYLRQFTTAVNHFDQYKEKSDQYLHEENVGFDGIELMYEEELRGQLGSKTYPIDAIGQITGNPIIEPPVKGNDLFLTIDLAVQEATERAIVDHLERLTSDPTYTSVNRTGTEASSAFVVAMEVETGRVVSMVSYPDYDPNIWRGGKINSEDLAQNQLLFGNGSILGKYAYYLDDIERGRHPGSLVPLGSIMKPATILIGLQEGLITPETTYQDDGVFYYGQNNSSRIRNTQGGTANGLIDAVKAIEKSSNTFMAELIGNPLYFKYGVDAVDVWDSYVTQFGLGVSTESGLPNEQTGVKDYYAMKENASAQAAMIFSSFGQGARYTALQLAQYATVLASKGKRIQPQFVDKIVSYDGTTVYDYDEQNPVVLNTLDFADEYWDIVHEGMLGVSKRGFDDFPYAVAAKTGTSQADVGGRTVENATFIAYAPAEAPKLAVAVVVPEGGWGSWGAAPIAAEVFKAYDASIGLN